MGRLGLATEWIEIAAELPSCRFCQYLGLATEWIEIECDLRACERGEVSVLRPSGLKCLSCPALPEPSASRSCDRVDWNRLRFVQSRCHCGLGLATEWIEIIILARCGNVVALSRSCDRADRISINIMLDFPCFTRSNKDTHIAVLTIYPCLCYTPTHLTVYSYKKIQHTLIVLHS